ncbi:MAG: hypothetical protein O7I93_03730 [Gemmatimonadetes bacterium]|nr:hypothetical protein [Gemmatimonadota bacterium]
MHHSRALIVAASVAIWASVAAPSVAQQRPGRAQPHMSQGPKIGGSVNVDIASHVPLGGFFRVTDVEIEQEMSRPYVYVSQTRERAGFSIIDVSDPDNAQVGGPDANLGAVVFDVTDLPDVSKVREVGRIRAPENYGKIGEVPVPESPLGFGGYHVYDITTPEMPELLFSITGVPGITFGHTFTPTPDAKFAVVETEYQYAPLRIFDLRPGQTGQQRNLSRPVGAWTADWEALSHNHEVRWPYVFVSAYEDGLQVFSIEDPENPVTLGWYYTYNGPHMRGYGGSQAEDFRGTSVMNGAFGIDVRNEDGLIVITDSATGLWVFRMDGFGGWSGEDWGMPNISSAQDWDNGPVKPPTVF